jgi:hypothetical protein
MQLTRLTPAAAAQSGAEFGLPNLRQLPLTQESAARWEALSNEADGERAWRQRKLHEAQELLALAQLAPGRLKVLALSVRGELRAGLALNTPVPLWHEAAANLVVGWGAVLDLHYPSEVVHRQLPGTSFLRIIAPEPVWHANVVNRPGEQVLCLGQSLPAGIRAAVLLVMAYRALSLTQYQVDERDAAGVLNAEAARWWQQNLHLAPLTREPFLLPQPTSQQIDP